MPFAWANRQVLFHLGWASGDYEVRVNGLPVACNADGNNPAEINLTKLTKEGRNSLEIVVAQPSPTAPLESWKEAPRPAIGGAWVMSQPTLHIRDVITRTRLAEDGSATAEVAVVLKSDALNPRTSRIHYELLDPTGERAAAGHKDFTLDMRREDTLRFLTRIPLNMLWCAELPTQYTLRLKTQHEGRYVEFLEFRPGFRAVEMHDGRMSVNGQPVTARARSARLDHRERNSTREQGIQHAQAASGSMPNRWISATCRGLYVSRGPRSASRRSRGFAPPGRQSSQRSGMARSLPRTRRTATIRPSVTLR